MSTMGLKHAWMCAHMGARIIPRRPLNLSWNSPCCMVMIPVNLYGLRGTSLVVLPSKLPP